MFIGRDKELKALDRLYKSDKFEVARTLVMYADIVINHLQNPQYVLEQEKKKANSCSSPFYFNTNQHSIKKSADK